jgi:hypothetical protein
MRPSPQASRNPSVAIGIANGGKNLMDLFMKAPLWKWVRKASRVKAIAIPEDKQSDLLSEAIEGTNQINIIN